MEYELTRVKTSALNAGSRHIGAAFTATQYSVTHLSELAHTTSSHHVLVSIATVRVDIISDIVLISVHKRFAWDKTAA